MYELIPPEGDKKVGEKVFEILAEILADKVKLGLHERWFRNYQLRKNQHWKTKSPQGVPLVSANLLFTHIQRTTNTMTDNNPTFNVAQIGKLEEEKRQSLSDLQHCTEHWWNDQEQQDVLESSVINGEEYGCAIEKVLFNPDIEYGLGEVETIPVDPFHFGFYPVKLRSARDLQKSDMVCHFYPESVRKLKAKYPKLAEKIKPDDELLKELKDDERRELTGQSTGKQSALVSIANAVKTLVNFVSGTGTEEGEEETLVCEAWVRDKSTASEDVKEEDRTVRNSVPKYTGEIRYVLVCSGGIVLEDRDNPNINQNLSDDEARNTYLYDKFPFSMVNSVKDTSTAWGLSDYEQLEWLQMEMNKSLSQLILEKDRSARKKLINPKDSGVRNEEFINYPNIVSPSSTLAAQGIRWLETPQSSVDYDKAVALFKDLFMLISGTFDLDQAQVQGRDVIAYKAIAALMERSATMMRGKIRAYSRLIRERGRMYLSHVMNFYTEERWITFTDQDGREAAKPIIGSSLIMPAKLTVVSGSTMPISRVQQREEALALFQQQAIDQQELLDRLDWSNRADVIKRMQAGPLGAALQNLQTAGTPPPILQYIQQIGLADPKEIKRALEKGEIPPFMALLQQLLQQGQPAPPDPIQKAEFEAKMAEVKKTLADVERIMAERELVIEKTMTEKVDQQVKQAGVAFDEETLKIKRAELVSTIEREAAGQEERGMKAGMDFVSNQQNRPGYNERNGKSNNREE